MKFQYALYVVLIVFTSCSSKKQFPEKLSKKIPLKELNISINESDIEKNEATKNKDFPGLKKYVSLFNSKDESFDLTKFEHQWKLFSDSRVLSKWNDAEIADWIEITGLLLELTNNTIYAKELGMISLHTKGRLQQKLLPYVFTKRVDHIYVNLFQPLEINYTHTLGGAVKFSQETNYPKSGSIKMHVGMTERRYIELYIRIPDWAEGATVTVKKVKYFAVPGSYCVIAKKWNEGDLVEVEFPIEKRPN